MIHNKTLLQGVGFGSKMILVREWKKSEGNLGRKPSCKNLKRKYEEKKKKKEGGNHHVRSCD